MTEMPWATVLNRAVSLRYLSHSAGTCGLHIHVSRRAFGDNSYEQDEAIARVLFYSGKQKAKILHILATASEARGTDATG